MTSNVLRDFRGQACSAVRTPSPRYGVISVYSGTSPHVRAAVDICIVNGDRWADDPADATACDQVPAERRFVFVSALPTDHSARFDDAWLAQAELQIADAMARRPGATGIWLDTLDAYWHNADLAQFQQNVPRLVQWVHEHGWKIGANVAADQLPSNLPESERFDLAAIERTGDDGSLGNPVSQSVVPGIRMAVNTFPVKPGGRTLMVHAPIEGDRALALGVTSGVDHVIVGPALGQYTDCGTSAYPCWGHGGQPFTSNLGRCTRGCEIQPGHFRSVCDRGQVYWNDTNSPWSVGRLTIQPHDGHIARN